MSIGISRLDEETWLQAALRYAAPWGLEWEVEEFYNRAIARGETEEDAALEACMEWDVAALEAGPPVTPADVGPISPPPDWIAAEEVRVVRVSNFMRQGIAWDALAAQLNEEFRTQPVTLTCQCCGFSESFDSAKAAHDISWDCSPWFNSHVTCPLCPSSYLFIGDSEMKQKHLEAHETWAREGRP
jgi:hypothetical protein